MGGIRWQRWLAALALSLQAVSSHAADAAPAQARQRGALVVGVSYLTPEPAAGAKIRTAERLDVPAAQRLAEIAGLPLQLRHVPVSQAADLLASGEVDLVLADRVSDQPLAGSQAPGLAVVPTGYQTRPQAVIRSDTPMRRWADVAGRRVCMAAQAEQAIAWAQHWRAEVQTFPVPSDALVAVREGRCDIGLVSDRAWKPLMVFPEWKKFSATLPVEGPVTELVWLAPEAHADWLRGLMRDWRRQGEWSRLAAQWSRDVAFDVYLDQEVPDCHG